MFFMEAATRFSPGRLLASPLAVEKLGRDEILKAFCRHLSGDWGDVPPADKRRNEIALRDETRLFSVYHTASGQEFWIITEADRSATSVQLYGEY